LNNGCDAKDLKLYISRLEKWIISTLAEFKIQAFTIPGKIGIWIKNSKNENAKIASIGLRIRKWVAYHGIAINIHTNLDHYSGIIPCGINNFPITSLRDIGIDTSIEEFDIILKKIFIETF
jgi:lipoyl(octanoyl) transferase